MQKYKHIILTRKCVQLILVLRGKQLEAEDI